MWFPIGIEAHDVLAQQNELKYIRYVFNGSRFLNKDSETGRQTDNALYTQGTIFSKGLEINLLNVMLGIWRPSSTRAVRVRIL